MKTIGLIGGMSWESSDTYYQVINRGIRDRLGNLNSADIIMHSLNFAEVEEYQRTGQWDKASEIIANSAMCLEVAGAKCILICSVTGHEGFKQVRKKITVPLIHIVDCVNSKIEGMKKIGLLGTIYTMEKDYFKGLVNADVIIPNKNDREFVSSVIYNEISQGIIDKNSKMRYISIINKLASNGAEGVILGCTEIPLLIKQDDVKIPVFDSTKLHAELAIKFSLGG